MTDDAALLAGLPNLAFAFALVLSRVGAAVMLLPGLGEAEPPPMVRAGLALALTLLLLPGVAPLVPVVPAQWGSTGMVAAELLAGAALGWLARLPCLALSMTGAVVSYMTGLSSVVQPDPALGGQSAALSRLLGLMAPVLILSSGLYAVPLAALAGSYHVIPPGGVMPAGPTGEAVLAAASASFALAVRLAGPFLFAGLLLQAALGLLARLAPQLQVFNLVAPAQVLGGVALLALLLTTLLPAWSEVVRAEWLGLPGL